MNLRHLTDEQIHADTKALVKEERQLLNRILYYLMENDRRRLFSAHKKESLHEYCVSLGYTDSAASRRITAMRVLRECPAIEHKLESAELDLSHLLVAKNFFSQEEKQGRELSSQKKEEVIDAMAGHSVRDAARIAQTFSPNPMPIKELLKLEISEEGMKNIKHLRGLRAHSNPGITNAELFELLVEEDIARKTAEPKRPRANSKAEMHREVRRRDQNKCTNCGSQYALEHDHRIPRGAGGADTVENFRTLCRSCNQRAAIEFYGQGKMDPFINSNVRRESDLH